MPNYLTRQDEDNYGRDLLDVTQRAAMHAVAPHLQNLQQQNATLRQKLAKEERHRMDQQVEAAVPDFREIDKDPAWHRWLLGIDVLTGRQRQVLLNDAIARGSASRAIEFFRRFQQEQGASAYTGSYTQTAPTFSRRSSSSVPTYTRDTIKQLYELHRKGAYAGREAEWNRIEADIFRAQREGRVAGVYLTK
jgi:hypothetical protein